MSACFIISFLKTSFLNALLYLGEVIKHFICSVCACVGAGARIGFFMFKMLFDNPWMLLSVFFIQGG